jgi:hypothetical protein
MMYSRDLTASKLALRNEVESVILNYQADEGYKYASALLRYYDAGLVKLHNISITDSDEIIAWKFAPWGGFREEKYIILRFGKRGKLKVADDV